MSDGLEFQGFTLDNWIDEFQQSTAVSRREAKKVLRQGAKDIIVASKQMCPVDEGNLEQAHHISEITLNENRTTLELSVGGEVGGRNVDAYALNMHENLAPFGSGTAGKVSRYIGKTHKLSKSYIKDQTNPSDRRVGGKFLERAAALFEQKIIAQIKEILVGK